MIPPVLCTALTSLKVLILDHNAIVQLPDAISMLTRLERLAVASNALAALPASVGKLLALKELDVSGNKLKVQSTEHVRLATLLAAGFARVAWHVSGTNSGQRFG